MKIYIPKFVTVFVGLFLFSSLFVPHGFASKDLRVETKKRLQIVRSVSLNPTKSDINKYNLKRSKIWNFFLTSKRITLPILERELKAEIEKKDKNDFFLLEVGHFLFLQGSTVQKNKAVQALYSIDASKISKSFNFNKLFNFTYRVSKERYPGILAFIDGAFLSKVKQRVVISKGSVNLDNTMICVFLYGAYGPDSENHLLKSISNPLNKQRVIEVLTWVGSEQSVIQVKKTISQETDYALLTSALTYLLQNGGSEGLQVVRELNTNKFDKDLRNFYDRIQKAARMMSLESLTARYSRHPGKLEYSDQELKLRLSHMYDNGRLDRQLNPLAIINSKLPKHVLLLELGKIRHKIFSKISNQGIGDIQFINALMNTIQFR